MKYIWAFVAAVAALQLASAYTFELKLGSHLDEVIRRNVYKPRAFEKEINDTLECFRSVLSVGLPEHNIPSFSPLELEGGVLNLTAANSSELHGHLGLSNVVVAGLMGWETTHLKGSLNVIGGLGLNLELTMLFPSIHFTTLYDADLKVSDIEVWGRGDITAEITNLEIAIDLKALLARISIAKLSVLPTADNINVKFTGLFDSEEQSELVNQILNSVLTNWINEKSEDISNAISTIVMDLVNNQEPGEPGEPGEPSIIDIILAECKEEEPEPEQ